VFELVVLLIGKLVLIHREVIRDVCSEAVTLVASESSPHVTESCVLVGGGPELPGGGGVCAGTAAGPV